MEVDKNIMGENPVLKQNVGKDTELKEWLVNYVGEKKQPEDGNVTVEMTLDVVAREFPEFVLSLAEENFVRGYYQAMMDIEEQNKLIKEQPKKKTIRRKKKTTKKKDGK
tara:strand:- start:1250 stop:1576 length:327 start_codon:yes stop_codon:yes gene_type:complete